MEGLVNAVACHSHAELGSSPPDVPHLFLSDTHLDCSSRGLRSRRTKAFFRLVRSLRSAHHVVLLGDVLDGLDASGRLALRAACSGHRVTVVSGNHDPSSSIGREFGRPRPGVLVGDFVAIHGHQLDRWWRGEVGRWSAIAASALESLDRRTEHRGSMLLGDLGAPERRLRLHTSWMRRAGGPFLIFGHTHRPFLTRAAANCGSWVDESATTFVSVDHRGVTLHRLLRSVFS